jgi:hypothetical protein
MQSEDKRLVGFARFVAVMYVAANLRFTDAYFARSMIVVRKNKPATPNSEMARRF